MTDTERDDQALELRRNGKSFRSIAGALALDRSRDAIDAVHRSIRRRPARERARLRKEELRRLDDLAARLQRRDSATPEVQARRVRVVEWMRTTLLAD